MRFFVKYLYQQMIFFPEYANQLPLLTHPIYFKTEYNVNGMELYLLML